jgi:serine/threonine-protein kinase
VEQGRIENPLDIPTPPVDKPAPNIPRLNDLTGRTLGDFQLIRRLGQGGMGEVYLSRQLSLNRQVAIKILRADLAANETSLHRFQQEARAVAAVTHANIVQIYSIDQADGLHFMALEYVEGRNLREYINRKGPPDVPIAINIMRQVAAALQRASELGFVHRDIKPENILLTRKGEVKVADFGLSRCFATDQPLNLTQSGVSMGTPLYMSPEQVQGRTLDPRSDIYSFGVSCYHMLAGEPPFKGESPFEVALQHVQNSPRRLTEIRPDLPAELAGIIHKMMAKKPEDRYQTGREILRDLTCLKEGVPTTIAKSALAESGIARVPASPSTELASAPSSARTRWPLWLLAAVLLTGAGAAGAAIHWKSSSPSAGTRPPDEANGESFPNPNRAVEKDLLRKLNERNIKSDVEAVNALLDLAMLYVREKRFAEAQQLFDDAQLRKFPAVAKAKEQFKMPVPYLTLLGTLGRGIVLANADLPENSNEEFKSIMTLSSAKGKPLPRQPVDEFLWKYDWWKKAVADALERNSKNLGAKLEEPLNRYRSYTKMP